MLNYIEAVSNAVNWASLLQHILSSLFHEVWIHQGVGNCGAFISLLNQRLTDTFIQNWRARLAESTTAGFYKPFAVFQLQPYLDKVNERKCANCSVLEDEFHFVLECLLYLD